MVVIAISFLWSKSTISMQVCINLDADIDMQSLQRSNERWFYKCNCNLNLHTNSQDI